MAHSKAGKRDRQKRELQRLQVAVARQQAEMGEQAPIEVPPIKPVIGMPADVILTLKGYSRKDRLRSPVTVGWDRFGLKVKWYFHDMTLLLKRTKAGGLYEVVETEERGSDVQEGE